MSWIKNNIVGIVFGILGSIGVIGSIASQVQDMAAAYPQAFWWWTAAMLLVGVFVGTAVSGLGKRKSEDRLAAIREAEETKRTAIAEEWAAERARIEHDAMRDMELMRQERAERTAREQKEQEATNAALQAQAAEAEKRASVRRKFLGLSPLQMKMVDELRKSEGVIWKEYDDPTMLHLAAMGAVESPAASIVDHGNLFPVSLTPSWRATLIEHEDLFESVLFETFENKPE